MRYSAANSEFLVDTAAIQGFLAASSWRCLQNAGSLWGSLGRPTRLPYRPWL